MRVRGALDFNDVEVVLVHGGEGVHCAGVRQMIVVK